MKLNKVISEMSVDSNLTFSKLQLSSVFSYLEHFGGKLSFGKVHRGLQQPPWLVVLQNYSLVRRGLSNSCHFWPHVEGYN